LEQVRANYNPMKTYPQILSRIAVLLTGLAIAASASATIFVTADNGTTNLFGTLDPKTGQFTQIATTTPLFYALTTGPNGELFGADLNSGNLYTISTAGATAQFGSSTAPAAFYGLAYSSTSGNFFADNLDPNNVTLYSIAADANSNSSIGVMAGPNSGFFPTGNLTFGPSGNLYFDFFPTNGTSSTLYIVNTATGALSPVGSGLGTDILALFFDGTTLYGIDANLTSNIGIYTIDTTTGVATRVATVTGLPSTNDYFLDTATSLVAIPGPQIDGRGTIAGPSGRDADFFIVDVENEQITAKYLEGEFGYTDHKSHVTFTTGKIETVTINGNNGAFTGTGRIGGKHKQTVQFMISVTANQKPATGDTFSIVLSNGYTASGHLTSGKILIRTLDPD
jgi:hypothetical protein